MRTGGGETRGAERGMGEGRKATFPLKKHDLLLLIRAVLGYSNVVITSAFRYFALFSPSMSWQEGMERRAAATYRVVRI